MENELGLDEISSTESTWSSNGTGSSLQFGAVTETMKMNAGNLDWSFNAEKTNLQLPLNCELKLTQFKCCTSWIVEAHVSLFLRQKTSGDHKETCVEKLFRNEKFTFKRTSLEFLISNEELVALTESKEQFSELKTDHQITMELQISVVNKTGLRMSRKCVYDFSKRSNDSDLALVFNKKKLYVNVGYLSVFSDYFAATRERLHLMKHDDETSLPCEHLDIDYDKFSELLEVVYPGKKPVTEENVHFLLPLADRFLFDGILVECERFLMSNQAKIDVFTKLEWSGRYFMTHLQNFCLQQLSNGSEIAKVRNSSIYQNISPEVVTGLFERLLDIQ